MPTRTFGQVSRADTLNAIADPGLSQSRLVEACLSRALPYFLSAHPHSCNIYIVCNLGKPSLARCLPGLHFSPSKMTCVAPKDAGCKSAQQHKIPVAPADADVTYLCLADPKKVFMEANPHDCSKYVACDHGRAVELECASGQHFHPKNRVCVAPEHAGCKATAVADTEGWSQTLSRMLMNIFSP